jgi:hypothetical protein
VNGAIAIADGVPQEVLAGRPLRRSPAGPRTKPCATSNVRVKDSDNHEGTKSTKN